MLPKTTKPFKIDDEYSFLTKSLLIKEYLKNNLNDAQIAKKYNVKSKTTIWRRRKFFNISNKFLNKTNKNASINRKNHISKRDAIDFINDNLTYIEIANQMNCSRMVVYRRLKELGLIKDQKKNLTKLRWHENLSKNQTKFLLGCLLGDGSITSRGMFQCSHSHKQLEYIQYKKEILRNLIAPDFKLDHNFIKNNQNGKIYETYHLRTMSNENLKNLRDIYYINSVKTFPINYLEKSVFDEYSLAIWYMDDGGINGNTPSIYTYDFGYKGNLEILRFLKKRFGLNGMLVKNNDIARNNDKRHFISFRGIERKKFFSIILSYILPCFKYKLPKNIRQ